MRVSNVDARGNRIQNCNGNGGTAIVVRVSGETAMDFAEEHVDLAASAVLWAADRAHRVSGIISNWTQNYTTI